MLGKRLRFKRGLRRALDKVKLAVIFIAGGFRKSQDRCLGQGKYMAAW